MEESRSQRLQQLLRKLGDAVHRSVGRSDDVRTCLAELHDDGWHAVMLLEASVACRDDGSIELEQGTLRLHVDVDRATAEYRLDSQDVRVLSSLGIAAGRHRSPAESSHRPPADRETEPGT